MLNSLTDSDLAHLRRPHTQRRDPDTHLLLDLGIRLMVSPPTEITTDLRERVPQLRWPTREELVRAYNTETGLRRSKAIVEDRWIRMADYHRDLIGWALLRLRVSTRIRLAEMGATAHDGSAADIAMVASLSASAIERLVRDQSFPLWSMLTALGGADPILADLLMRAKQADLRNWTSIAQAHVNALGRSLTPAVNVVEVAELMGAMAHGLVMRYLSDPEHFDHDPARIGALFAQTARALVDAMLTPADTPRAGTTSAAAAIRRPRQELVPSPRDSVLDPVAALPG